MGICVACELVDGRGYSTLLAIDGVERAVFQRTPDSDSDRSRRGNEGALTIEVMEVMDPFGPPLGGGDCVDLSVLSNDPPLGADAADVEPEVPSDV